MGELMGLGHGESQEVFVESWRRLRIWSHDLGVFS